MVQVAVIYVILLSTEGGCGFSSFNKLHVHRLKEGGCGL